MENKGFSTYTADVASKRKLTAEKITDLFGICVLKQTDFDSKGLPCDFRIGEGVSGESVFSAERLNAHREEIDDYIGQLSNIENAPSFANLCYDSCGIKWTEDTVVVDMLVKMGMASNMLFFTLPNQLWPYLPGGVPFVGKTIYDQKKTVSGIESKEYLKYAKPVYK